MPMVNVKVIEDVFTPQQKQEMIRKFTDVIVSMEGEKMRQATLVVIEEIKSGDWGFAGKAMTTQDAKDLGARKEFAKAA
jgi:4-oxalocrotonate tautomerase